MKATGQYRCEVITEAPHFFTKFGEGNMTVIGKKKIYINLKIHLRKKVNITL